MELLAYFAEGLVAAALAFRERLSAKLSGRPSFSILVRPRLRSVSSWAHLRLPACAVFMERLRKKSERATGYSLSAYLRRDLHYKVCRRYFQITSEFWQNRNRLLAFRRPAVMRSQ